MKFLHSKIHTLCLCIFKVQHLYRRGWNQTTYKSPQMHGLKLTERFKSTEVHAFGSSSSKTNCGNSSKALVAAATKPHNYLNRNKTMLPSWSKTKSRTTNNNSTSSVADLAPSVVCVVEVWEEGWWASWCVFNGLCWLFC